jgi:hypothetical protein
MIKLTNLLTEAPKPKSIDVSYIERSGKLYKIRVDGIRMYEDVFKKQFGIDIPTRYDERELVKIEKLFKKNRIQFTYNDSMDVS